MADKPAVDEGLFANSKDHQVEPTQITPTKHLKKGKLAGILVVVALLLLSGIGLAFAYNGYRQSFLKTQKSKLANSIDTTSVDLAGTASSAIQGIGILQVNGDANITGSVTANTFNGSGADLTNLNANNITSGTLDDARLSANVALLDATQTFTGNNTFTGANSYSGSNNFSGPASFTGTVSLPGTLVINSLTYNMPSAQGAGALINDGNGNLVWATVSACPTCITDGGNSFGTAIAIGSNDSNNLTFRTNGITRLTFNTSGDATFTGAIYGDGTQLTGVAKLALNNQTFVGNNQVFQNTTNSTSAFEVKNAGAVNVLSVDTQNGKVIAPTIQANTITPTSAMTIGSTSQTLTLNGGASSSWVINGTGFSTSVGFNGVPVGNVMYYFDRTAAAGNYAICTSAGNCGGGGGITGGGTAGTIAKFSGPSGVTDSLLSESGSTVTVDGTFKVETVGSDYTSINSYGLSVYNNTAGTTTNYILPVAGNNTYDLCTSSGNCFGSGGVGANTALSNLDSATIAINTSLLPGPIGPINLGSNTKPFGDLFIYGSSILPATNNFKLTGTATAQRTITFPDENGTVCTTGSVCSGYANNTLSNLGTVALNSVLQPALPGSLSLGYDTKPFSDLYLSGSSASPATNRFQLTGTSSGGLRVITMPDATGTICLENSTSCGFATSSGSGNYIQNQTASTQSAGFKINGTGTLGTLNATSTIQLGGTNINTGGTLSNVAYLDQANTFTAAGTALTVDNNATITGTLTSGLINGQTISSSANFTGTATVAGPSLTLGTASVTNGSAVFKNATNSLALTLSAPNTTQARAIYFPDEDGTICTTGSVCSGYAPSGSYANTDLGNLTTTAIDQDLNFVSASGKSITGPGSPGLTVTNDSGDLTLSTTTSGTLALNSDGAVNISGHASSTWSIGASSDLSIISKNLNLNSGGALTIGSTGASSGTLVLKNSAAGSGIITLGANNSSASSYAITFPNETGTVCTTGSVCSGYAPASGGSYANQALSNLSSVAINTSLLPGANNTIDAGSSGLAFRSVYGATSVLTPLVDTISAGTLSFGTTNATAINLNQNTTVGSGKTFAVSGNSTFSMSNDKSVTITSDLTSAARSSSVLSISQADNATNNSTAALVSLTNSDTGSAAITAPLMNLSQVTTGTNIRFANTIQSGGYGLYFAAGVGNGVSGGTGIYFGTAGIANGGRGIDTGFVAGSSIGVDIGGSAVGGSTLSSTGALLRLRKSHTISSSQIESGNFLKAERLATSAAGLTYTISGALFDLSSNCTANGGTCTDTSNLLNVNQLFSSASGTILNISGAGTGNLATLDASNSSANGMLIDVQSSSASQYALKVTSNNGGTTGLEVKGDGTLTTGTINGQTISSAANFTGTATVAGSSLTLGTASSTAGSIVINNATNAFTTTLLSSTTTSNKTITFPNEDGTVCTTGSVCSGYAPSATNGYVQLSPASQQTGSINVSSTINGATISGGTLSGGSVSGSTLTGQSLTFTTAGASSINSASGQALNLTGSAASTWSVGSTNALTLTSSNLNLSGGALTIGTASSTAGSIVINNASNALTTTLLSSTATSSKTITFPNETGTVCTTGSVCSGYAPASGSTNYFAQGGNSFATTASIGTNDANNLVLKTGNTGRFTINSASANFQGNGATTITSTTTMTLNSAATSALSVGGASTSGSITIGSALTTGDITIGNASAAGSDILIQTGSSDTASMSAGVAYIGESSGYDYVRVQAGLTTIAYNPAMPGGGISFDASAGGGTIATINNSGYSSAYGVSAASLTSPALDYAGTIDIGGTNATQIDIGRTGSVTKIYGTTSTTALEIYNGAGTPAKVFNFDTTNNRFTIGGGAGAYSLGFAATTGSRTIGITGSVAGALGGDLDLSAGQGGAGTASVVTGNAGGSITLTAAAGGAGYSIGNNNGGVGGDISITSGTGGAATNSGTSGNGGALTLTTGSPGTTPTGGYGASGSITLASGGSLGASGAVSIYSADSAGNSGAVLIQAGSSGFTSGDISIVTRAGGTTATTGRVIITSPTNSASGALSLAADSTTTGIGLALSTTALTTGKGLSITGPTSGATLTGNLLYLSSASTGNLGTTVGTSGAIAFDLSGAHTGFGFQLRDNTASGTAMRITANAVSTGKALEISSTTTLTTGNLLRVANTSAGAYGTTAGTSGAVLFDFNGNHSGIGFQLRDTSNSTTANAMQINATSLGNGGNALVVNGSTTSGADIFELQSGGVTRIRVDDIGSFIGQSVVGTAIGTTQSGGSTSACYDAAFGYNYLKPCASSIRYKQNVQDLSANVDDLMLLRPVEYDWKTTGLHDLGIIAEEAEAVNPLYVVYTNDADGNSQVESVKYDKLVSLLIKGYQAHDNRITALEQGLSTSVLQAIADANAITINGTLTINGRTIFNNEVSFDQDTAGDTTVAAGDTTKHVSFSKTLSKKPVVNVTPQDFINGGYKVVNVTTTGFDVELQNVQSGDVVFSWQALLSQ
jgi:hypothetical protein